MNWKLQGAIVDRFDTGELLRIARRRMEQYHCVPPSTLRAGGELSPPDLIYHLAKHIEGLQEWNDKLLLRLKAAGAA